MEKIISELMGLVKEYGDCREVHFPDDGFEAIRARLHQALERKPLTDEKIEERAKPFIRSLGGDHWYSGEDGIPDRGQIEEFARAIESAHGIDQCEPGIEETEK